MVMTTADPWAKYPKVTQPAVPQQVQGDDPWAAYPKAGATQTETPPPAEPSFLQSAQSAIGDVATQAGSMVLNPIGAAVETANQIPGVQDWVPDSLAQNDTAKGTVKGVYNAAQHTAQLGADVQDFLIPGNATPVSDLLNTVAPEAKYTGTTQAIAGNLTEVVSGFMAGNRVGAIEKVAGVTKPIAEKVATLADKTAGKLGKIIWDGIKGGTKGIAGMTATVSPQENGLFVGKHPMINYLGLNGFTAGLPTDSPDAAQNALSARINMALDAFITGAGITEASKGLSALHDITLAKVVTDKLKPAFSQAARVKAFFKGIEGEIQKIPGVKSEEEIQGVFNRMVELAGNKEAGQVTADFGIPGVEAQTVPLDTATTVARQVDSKAPSEVDQSIKNILLGEAKKLVNSGYEGAQNVREGPVTALGKGLEQTQEALGGAPSTVLGAAKVKELGGNVVQQGKTEGMLAGAEKRGTANTITDRVSQARDINRQYVNDLYEAIPADAKYDPASFHKIIGDSKSGIPQDILDTLKEGDGSFKYLYNKVRPKITSMISKLKDSTTVEAQDSLNTLMKLRDNIDGPQLEELTKSGRPDVAKAAKKAREAYIRDIADNQQGVVEDLAKIEDKQGFKQENIYDKSRDAIKKVLLTSDHPEHENRLFNVLASDEGNRSESLIERYKNAANKEEELSHIEDEVYGNKLRNFFEKVGQDKYEGMPNSMASFQKLLEDEQGLDRIKYITKLAEDSGDKSVNQALKYSYAKQLADRLYPGHVTSLGNKAVSSQQIHSTLNDTGFIQAGREIYKDAPEFMDTVGDFLKISDEIEKSVYLRPNLKNASDYVAETAKKALTKVTNVIYGPLSHRSLQMKTFFGALLEVLDPQVAMGRTADALMTNGELFAHAYAEMAKPQVSSEVASTSMKILANAIFHNKGERDKFDKVAAKVRTQLQTDEALKGSSGTSENPGGAGKDKLMDWPSEKEIGKLKLNPQEQNLYDHHLTNMKSGKTRMSPRGSTSTILMQPIKKDGKYYAVPRIWNGRVISEGDADNLLKKTTDMWPSYKSLDELNKRYGAMHDIMEKDVNYLEDNSPDYQWQMEDMKQSRGKAHMDRPQSFRPPDRPTTR